VLMTEQIDTSLSPFHLEFPVGSLEATRAFYGELLDWAEVRSSDRWIDYDHLGHQLAAHQPEGQLADGQGEPVPHFGAVLPWTQWLDLADRLRAAEEDFVIEPYIRFEGELGEQAGHVPA
jgi:extradiol dioxygenase family protein